MYEDVPGEPHRALNCPRCASRSPRMVRGDAERQWFCEHCLTIWEITNVESDLAEFVAELPKPVRSRVKKAKPAEGEQ